MQADQRPEFRAVERLGEFRHGIRRDRDLGVGQRVVQQRGRGVGIQLGQPAGRTDVLVVLGEVGADEGELVVPWELLQLVDALDGPLVEEVAADAVVAVGRIGDEAAGLEHGHAALHVPRLRVHGVDR